MQIDQAGLPAGTPGRARTDGLDTGALLTFTSLGAGTTHEFRLLWVPPEDLTALATLMQTGPTTWTSSPQAGTWGTYRIELIVDKGLPTEDRQIRIFGVRTPDGILIPAANESADPSATLENNTPAVIARSENNEPFGPFVTGSAWGWWAALRDALVNIAASGGIRWHLPAPVVITVKADFQYLVQGALVIDGGAALVALPGSQVVVLP